MKKILKYIFLFLAVGLLIIAYFYSKPAVVITQSKIEKKIPIKIGPAINDIKNDTLIAVYLPYKIKVQNNRFKKIEFGLLKYKYNVDHYERFIYDKNGFGIDKIFNYETLDSLYKNQKYVSYFQLNHNNEIFSFSSEEFYFYLPYVIKISSIEETVKPHQYKELIKDFFNNQARYIFKASKFKIKKHIIDSLYRKGNNSEVIFRFDPSNSYEYGSYSIDYNLITNKQVLEDYTNVSAKQILKEMREEILNK